MTSRDCGTVFLLVMITCICLGHIICTFEDSTKNKIYIFQVPPIVEKIILIKNQTIKCVSPNAIYLFTYTKLRSNGPEFKILHQMQGSMQ